MREEKNVDRKRVSCFVWVIRVRRKTERRIREIHLRIGVALHRIEEKRKQRVRADGCLFLKNLRKEGSSHDFLRGGRNVTITHGRGIGEKQTLIGA